MERQIKAVFVGIILFMLSVKESVFYDELTRQFSKIVRLYFSVQHRKQVQNFIPCLIFCEFIYFAAFAKLKSGSDKPIRFHQSAVEKSAVVLFVHVLKQPGS